MPLLEWKDEYLLGMADMDFEHRDLFDRLNDLYEECVGAADADVVAQCLGSLQARLAAHFALEERTMLEMRNPHFAAHKEHHDRFLDEVTEVVVSFDSGFDEPELDAFTQRVKSWIITHITTDDRQLVERGG